jgi:hypothetical protein
MRCCFFSIIFIIVFCACEKNISKEQYFYATIIRGNKKLTEKYLREGVNVNGVDNMGMTPLILATKYDKTEIVKLLLKNNAKVNVKDKYKMSPMIYAVDNNNINVIKMLLKNGGSLNVYNASGQNPLTISASKKYYNLLKFLLSTNKIDVYRPDKIGETVFLYARHNEAIQSILKERGIAISTQKDDIPQQNENNLIILIFDDEIFFQNKKISKEDFKLKLKSIKKTKDFHVSIQTNRPLNSTAVQLLNFVINELKVNRIDNFDIIPMKN